MTSAQLATLQDQLDKLVRLRTVLSVTRDELWIQDARIHVIDGVIASLTDLLSSSNKETI